MVVRPKLLDPALSRPSGLLLETVSRLAGLRMSLLFLPIQPGRPAAVAVEDCDLSQTAVTMVAFQADFSQQRQRSFPCPWDPEAAPQSICLKVARVSNAILVSKTSTIPMFNLF